MQKLSQIKVKKSLKKIKKKYQNDEDIVFEQEEEFVSESRITKQLSMLSISR